MIIKAIQDIDIGQEITISYLETEYLCESQSFRVDRLPFCCNCHKCITQQSQNDNENDDDEEEESEDDGDCDDEEEEEESEDDETQIFDDQQCQILFSYEPLQRIKQIEQLMNDQDIRYIDKISGYCTKAMTFLEIKQYEQAGQCWMECVNTMKQSFGDIHEDMVPFYLQIVLCKITLFINHKQDDEDIIDIICNNQDILQLINQMMAIHKICFGDARLFLQRYATELSLSAYPASSKSLLLWNDIMLKTDLQ